MQSSKFKAHIVASLTMLVWGTTFVATKILLKSFSAIEIMIYRFVIGYIMLWILKPKAFLWTEWKTELLFFAAGIFGVTLYYLGENVALTYTTSSNVGVIVSIAPVFTIILSRIMLKKERLHAGFFVGFILAITGILIVSFHGQAVNSFHLKGDILAVLAALSWGFYSVFIKKISEKGLDTLFVTRRVFLYGIIFLVPFAFAMGFQFRIGLFMSAVNLIDMLYLGIIASAVCFVTWNWSVKVLGAIKTSAYIYAIPVINLAFSAIILNDIITPIGAFGAALALTGLIISEFGKPKG